MLLTSNVVGTKKVLSKSQELLHVSGTVLLPLQSNAHE